MEHRSKDEAARSETQADGTINLDAFLHPGRAFSHPMDVVRDSNLTLYEKRAILASWASDACAIEAAPELRINASGNVVRWDDIMDALRLLDREVISGKAPPHYKQVLAKKGLGLFGARLRPRNAGDHGPALN